MSSDWRHPQERDELVERVIAAEKRTRLVEQALRERVRAEELFLAGRPDVKALLARVVELEGIIERLNADRMSGKRPA